MDDSTTSIPISRRQALGLLSTGLAGGLLAGNTAASAGRTPATGMEVAEAETDPAANRSIILSIPGRWQDRSALVQSVAGDSGGYLLLGSMIGKIDTQEKWLVEVREHDPDLARTFHLGTGGRLEPQDLDAIDGHTFALVVHSRELSTVAALDMLRLGSGLLAAGGIAVKIDTAGFVHSASAWHQHSAAGELWDLYVAFVVFVRGEQTFYTCGMHNFGLPDCSVDRDLSPENAYDLLTRFNTYVLAEAPIFEDGHTFSLSAESPRYRLQRRSYDLVERDRLTYNPFGRWHLTQT